jgi:uncharacterized protein YcgI (DUF1989 family)
MTFTSSSPSVAGGSAGGERKMVDVSGSATTGSHTVAGGTGWGTEVVAGSLVRIVDVKGKQVGDLVLLRAADPTDRLSVGNTRKMTSSLFVSTGAVLWSTTYRQLARIEVDSVGRHDLIASACTPYDYPLRFGERGVGHRACLTNLREVLAPWGIPEHGIPDPMNVFMNQVVHPDGSTEVLEPLSKPGDHLDLRMLEDCMLALSACPQDLTKCNGWNITDLRVEIEAPEGGA